MTMPFLENTVQNVVYMTTPGITAKHAFTTRRGGASSGAFSSLNLGMNLGDDPGCVRENYAILCGALGIDSDCIVRSAQVHGRNVRIVASSDRAALFQPPACEADAMITCEPGVALIIYTADCVPILLHDPVRGVISAVHAGWRGSAADICGAVVERMKGEFGCVPSDIRAAIGPCIGGCCYEIGAMVCDMLRTALGSEAEHCVTAGLNEGKYMADLGEANRCLLQKAGVTDISMSRECTMCSNEKYWSHRYTGGSRGSQAALILL